MLLAVETSSSVGSIALMDKGVVIAERQLAVSGPRHAQTLVSELHRLLSELAISPAEIDAAAVSIGPGSFTGLRVGLTFAKTLAWLNNAPLMAVDTLRAIAQQAPDEEVVVTAVCDAQRGELFAAAFKMDPSTGLRHRLDDIRVVQVSELSLDYPVIGPLSQKLRERVMAGCRMFAETDGMPRAATVARIGADMYRRRKFANVENAEPVYVRVSYAEEKRVSSRGKSAPSIDEGT